MCIRDSTDAKIVELSANRITTGTLSVERLIIVGSEKSIVYTINEANGTPQLSQSTICLLYTSPLPPRR